MNAEEFGDIGYYFEQSLSLIVYSYLQVKKEKAQHPYSRRSIREITKKVRQSTKKRNEIEDFLRNDLVDNYLRKLRHLFLLTNFSIQAGSEESKSNVKTGIVDIRFENTSATCMDGTGFIFECKRLNKYSDFQKAYIEKGMMRFVSGQYVRDNGMMVAGMIAFVEVDRDKNPQGYLPVDRVADTLQEKINSEKDVLKMTCPFSPFKLPRGEYSEISNFKYSYISKHHRPGGNRQISIYHLLLDYYNILVA